MRAQREVVIGTESFTRERIRAIVDEHLDREYLVSTLSRLAKIPTEVPMGYETYIEPDDPKLVHYVQEALRPELAAAGHDLIDVPRNNLVVRAGDGSSPASLIVFNYTPAQHNNLMEDPFSGKVASAAAFGVDEPCVFGQGVSQTKAHQAVMLAVLRLLRTANVRLRGRLFWAVVNEGRSSHACSDAVLAALGHTPALGIIQLQTGMRITLGNRGRVDVLVHVRGKAAHSSSPHLGHSAIEGAHEVMTRLRALAWPDAHPQLGKRHVLVYKIRYWPLAPHTLPSDAYLTVDRRMLPGDDPDAAADEIRSAIGDLSPFEVTVERGPFMLPALVPVDHEGVRALQDAGTVALGRPLETAYMGGTFDAGGPCARGVPTVMFGSGGGVWPLGVDFVPVSSAVSEARVLATLILSRLA